MELAKGLLGTAVAATAATAAIAANAGVEHFSGVNMIGSAMVINPAYALLGGMAMGGGSEFKGAFGYKSLLRGMNPKGVAKATDYMSLGGVVLPLVEAGAKTALAAGMGGNNLFMHGASNARRYGLGNIVTSGFLDVEGLTTKTVTKRGKDIVKNYGDDVMRLLQNPKVGPGLIGQAAASGTVDDFLMAVNKGLGGGPSIKVKKLKPVYDALYNTVQAAKTSKPMRALSWLSGKNWMDTLATMEKVSTKGGSTGYMMATAGNTGRALLTKGSSLAKGMSIFSALSLIQIGGAAAMWAGGALLEGASQTLAYGVDMVMDSQRMELANGKLAPIFMGPNAATERQRAIKAVYNAKVNPSQRAFGNEAGYMHR